MALNVVERIDKQVKINHVLISVSDKRDLELLVTGLIEANPQVVIYSTGGTYDAIHKLLGPVSAGKHLQSVSSYTGQPEMQGGLVKTLDFKIYLGLLSETYNDAHQEDLQRTHAVAIDMVVVNLYPFVQTVSQAGVTPELARTNIDIGGPCMIRASAKNYLRVASVTEPADYAMIVDELKRHGGGLSLAVRQKLMKKAFAHTAAYDHAIADYFAGIGYEQALGCYQTES